MLSQPERWCLSHNNIPYFMHQSHPPSPSQPPVPSDRRV